MYGTWSVDFNVKTLGQGHQCTGSARQLSSQVVKRVCRLTWRPIGSLGSLWMTLLWAVCRLSCRCFISTQASTAASRTGLSHGYATSVTEPNSNRNEWERHTACVIRLGIPWPNRTDSILALVELDLPVAGQHRRRSILSPWIGFPSLLHGLCCSTIMQVGYTLLIKWSPSPKIVNHQKKPTNVKFNIYNTHSVPKYNLFYTNHKFIN